MASIETTCKSTGFVHCTSSQHVELIKLSAFEHPVETCWAVLSLVESNLKLFKLFAQRGSTLSLFRGHPCVAQQNRVHLHSNAQHVEPTLAQCPAYKKFPCRLQCSLHCPRSWALSQCYCSILYCFYAFYAESTLLFYHLVFLPFCPRQWVLLLEVQPSIFVFWGDEYTSDSQPWFNMSLCEIFGMLNKLCNCWGHLNTPLDNNSTSTNTQHVESLDSRQIQCIYTRLSVPWLERVNVVFSLAHPFICIFSRARKPHL